MEELNQTETWYGKGIESERVRLEDSGSGKPIVLRRLQFLYPPKGRKPTLEEILTPEYLKKLNDLLMLDGMELIQPPRVVYNKKGFDIFCTCQVKKGNIIPAHLRDQFTPIQQKLQEEAKKKVL